MQITIGNVRLKSEIKEARIPSEISDVLNIEASNKLSVTMPLRELKRSAPSDLELAATEDLAGITKLVTQFPDNAVDATEKGFLRGRFTQDEYKKLIEDKCIYVARDEDQIVAFASVLPWNHQMLSLERAVVSLKFGPIKIQFCRWTNKDFSSIVDTKPILYIADAAVSPEAPGAVSKLIDGLRKLRSENPECYIVTTCSEAPLPNRRSSEFLKRIGFERVGYAWLPFRPMSVGPYPGKTKLVSPFQSGIWLLEPSKENF